ncbi:MAG: putative cobaltochelatase [Chloroflexi bacterium]|nr:putative cobaltochelatase [Chloroflexota bacterium]
MNNVFPFTAIVGQEEMKRALVLNAVNSQIGGVLIRGERGTAKSTAVRALAALLPEIEVVADCPFSCDPRRPETYCDTCRERTARGEVLPIAKRRTKVIDLPVSATEDRVVGTLDIEKAIKKGEKRFEAGVLAAANRGLLYVDEVNLLDDHVVDLLLDSAAMGVNVVEREGISFSHPAQFILVGTMNPEEGELRPQLLDRFSLCVEISGITDPQARVEILDRRIAFERDPAGFYEEWQTEEQKLAEEITRAQKLLPRVTYSPQDLYAIAQMTAELGVDGHRADIVILKAGLAHASLRGNLILESQDILLAAELSLIHRIKKRPLGEDGGSGPEFKQTLQKTLAVPHQPAPAPTPRMTKKASDQEILDEDQPYPPPPPAPRPDANPEHSQPSQGTPQAKFQPGTSFKPRRITTPIDRATRNSPGKRSLTRTDRKRGRYIRSRPMSERVEDVAFDATLRQAAPHQKERKPQGQAVAVEKEDLQRKVRVRRTSNLILFVVDASWSMAAQERMIATKGAIMSLLQDAYQRRDRVGMIVFRKANAELLLAPTSSVHTAEDLLREIPVGGKTPLSGGLHLAHEIFTRELRKRPAEKPLMILLTDGAGNVAMGNISPREEGRRIAQKLRQSQIRSVVINTEHRAFDRGLAQELAQHLGGECYTLEELASQSIYQAPSRRVSH